MLAAGLAVAVHTAAVHTAADHIVAVQIVAVHKLGHSYSGMAQPEHLLLGHILPRILQYHM
jgi:hypothetical protein